MGSSESLSVIHCGLGAVEPEMSALGFQGVFLPSFLSAVELPITVMIPVLGQSGHIRHVGTVWFNGSA